MPTPEAMEAADHLLDAPPFRLGDRSDAMQTAIAGALDRFAAQRGAEADAVIEAARDLLANEKGDWVLSDRLVTALAAFDKGAPPQTGGGDAIRDILEETTRTFGPALSRLAGQSGDGDAGERARDDDVAHHIAETWCRTPDDYYEARAAINAALRDSYREGAEAMREADARACSERGAWAEAKIADDKDDLWANYSNACDDCAEIVHALPIPGSKTDAG